MTLMPLRRSEETKNIDAKNNHFNAIKRFPCMGQMCSVNKAPSPYLEQRETLSAFK